MATTRGMALTNVSKPTSFSAYLSGEKVKNKLMNFLPTASEQKMFIAGLASAVTGNPKLQNCEYGSIVSAGLKCLALGFMPGAQTGDVYLVPFETKCVMVPGYRGYVRLALRSGKIKALNMGCVRAGQTVVREFLSGKITVEGEPSAPDAPVLGYFAYMELLSGFQKTIFWTKEEAVLHAERHAKTPFSCSLLTKYEQYLQTGEGLTDQEIKETEGVYYKYFDKMSMKNCLRELLLGWAPLTLSDQQLVSSDGDSGFDDNDLLEGEGAVAEYTEKTAASDALASQAEGSGKSKSAPQPKEEANVADDFFSP